MIESDFSTRVEKYIRWLIAVAIGIKFVLFLYIAFVNQASIFQTDSFGYLMDARAWVHYFSIPAEGLKHSFYRTPGYSLFLAIFNLSLNLPLLSVVSLQIVLNILTAGVVFKTIHLADRRVGLLSAAVVLLDIPMTIFSSMIMTESLHVFVLALFLYSFVKYINSRHLGWLVLAALFLGATVYIRPVGYFLGIAVAGFILYIWGIEKIFTGLAHATAVLVLVYGFLGIWQYHNLKTHSYFMFTNIDHATIDNNGIIGRYARETEPQFRAMGPVLYYVDSVARNFFSLMTTPGDMKFLHSKFWKVLGISFGYSFVVFWWIGLVIGVGQCKRDIIGQFLLFILLYFIVVSIVSTGWHVTPRFRVPMVPFIAILSARGWVALLCRKGI